MLKDPICGMDVLNEKFIFEIRGKKYFFCSQGCLDKFKESSDEGSGSQSRYDLVIIGAGPAGLASAIQASALKINTLLITKDIGGHAVIGVKNRSRLGADFVSGKELIEKFEHQALHEHYLEHRLDEVVRINRIGAIFEVVALKEGNSVTAYALIIATGVKQGAPNTEFCKGLLKLNEKGGIIINSDCSASVEGIFACGDVTGCLEKKVIFLSQQGTKAVLSVKKYLLGMGIK